MYNNTLFICFSNINIYIYTKIWDVYHALEEFILIMKMPGAFEDEEQ